MILAGDIGGTKTVLALVTQQSDGVLETVLEQTYSSSDYHNFDEILELFLAQQPKPKAACFGVAGPVLDQRCITTNLPWVLSAEELKITLGTQQVKLLNDLEAMSLGMLQLSDKDFVELNPGAIEQPGNKAVIAAGTGLGEAILHWNGKQFQAMATEGGHCTFAPQNSQQDKLLHYLRKLFPEHVSYERLLSGNGFSHLYDFLLEDGYAPACPAVPEHNNPHGLDRNAVISRFGINGEDTLCSEAVRLFAELYGAEAGNLALKCLASGGIYIGGGIGPKIRPLLEEGTFIQAFTAKGRFKGMLEKLSVKLALNPKTPLLGAMHYFNEP